MIVLGVPPVPDVAVILFPSRYFHLLPPPVPLRPLGTFLFLFFVVDVDVVYLPHPPLRLVLLLHALFISPVQPVSLARSRASMRPPYV